MSRQNCRDRVADVIRRCQEIDKGSLGGSPSLSREAWLFAVREFEALIRVYPDQISRTSVGYLVPCPLCSDHALDISFTSGQTLLH